MAPSLSPHLASARAASCASTFKGYFASGLTCTAVPVVAPSASFVTVAVFSFLVGSLALCMPCAPTCLCGRATPVIMSIATGMVHIILFALAVQAMVAATLSTDSTSVSWSSAEMASALASFVSINTPSNSLLLKTSFNAPLTLVDVVAGVATGPIGVIVVCVVLVVLLLIAGSKNGGGGGSSSNCNCASCSPNVSCVCNCCDCATGTTRGGGVHFWYGPPWWWWWWQPHYYSSGRYYSRGEAAAPAPTVIVVSSPLLLQGPPPQVSQPLVPQQQGQSLGPAPAPTAPPCLLDDDPSLLKGTGALEGKYPTMAGQGGASEDPVAPAYDGIPPVGASKKSTLPGYQEQFASGQPAAAGQAVVTWGEPPLSGAGGVVSRPAQHTDEQQPVAEPYDNPHKWRQCGALTCVQLILACVVIGITVSSWKTFDCIVLATA